jgi:superfamily II DNA or RNA helicase
MDIKPRRLADYKVRPYTKTLEYFDQYQGLHRQHQLEALIAATQADKGQIISPCGTGKTRVQVSLHVQGMIDLLAEYEYGVFLIASHRLSLNRQLLDQLVDATVRCGLSFDIIYLGSYRADLGKYYRKYHHLGYRPNVSRHLISTFPKEIEKFVAESREMFRNVIIASTYDSFDALKNIGTINLLTSDEAHNTIQKDFTANIRQVKDNIIKQYYFTATRKVAGDNGGMNNEDFYGKVLIDISPKLMLDRGEIVAPRLHVIDGKDDQTTNANNTDMLVKNTLEAFNKHKVMVKQHSILPDLIGAVLLVGCNSIEEMERIYNNDCMRALADTNVQAFAISSDGCYVNWVKCGKEQFFTQLNGLSESQDAIIFNVDMLTEGIDLPSITGVMPLRNLGLTKLIQMIGRALRLHPIDREKLYALPRALTPGDYQQYIKPYGYLIIPRHLSSIDENPEMIKIAKEFYSQYGTTPDIVIIQEKYIDHQPEKLSSMLPYDFDGGKDYDLEHMEMSLIDEANLSAFKEDMGALKGSQKLPPLKEIFQ